MPSSHTAFHPQSSGTGSLALALPPCLLEVSGVTTRAKPRSLPGGSARARQPSTRWHRGRATERSGHLGFLSNAQVLSREGNNDHRRGVSQMRPWEFPEEGCCTRSPPPSLPPSLPLPRSPPPPPSQLHQLLLSPDSRPLGFLLSSLSLDNSPQSKTLKNPGDPQ